MLASNGLAPPRRNLPHLMIAGVAVLLLAACAAFIVLLNRLERTEVQVAALSQNVRSLQRSPLEMSGPDTRTGARNNLPTSQSQPVTYEGNGPVFDELRVRGSMNRITPEQQSLEQDELLLREVSIPSLEQKHKQWLGAAYQIVTEDNRAPPARDVQTVCRGRRCMISAVVQDRTSALQWSKRFLMASGGAHLKESKVAVIPARNGAYASVQLYLY